jgi:SAM-dependent methyltransferase
VALSLFKRRTVDIRAMRATRAIAGRVSGSIRSEGRWARGAAGIHDECFVPALFGEWAVRVADAAGLQPGARVLDVACGTGALAIEAARRVEPNGAVTGLDCSDRMLTAAKRKRGSIEWHLGKAESLRFEARRFDCVVSQFGLTCFEDRIWSLHEMWRVLRSGGRLTVAVFDRIAANAGYEALARWSRIFSAAGSQVN